MCKPKSSVSQGECYQFSLRFRVGEQLFQNGGDSQPNFGLFGPYIWGEGDNLGNVEGSFDWGL